jgi:DNA-directed RNA polymerase specialized sigma subunit
MQNHNELNSLVQKLVMTKLAAFKSWKRRRKITDIDTEFEQTIAQSVPEHHKKTDTIPQSVIQQAQGSHSQEHDTAHPGDHPVDDVVVLAPVVVYYGTNKVLLGHIARSLLERKISQAVERKLLADALQSAQSTNVGPTKTAAKLDSIDSLVQDYKRTRSPMVLEQIEKALQPQIQQAIYKYKASGVPEDLLENNILIILQKSIETYKPNSGASFATWFAQNLQQMYRFVNNLQGALYLPEEYKREYAKFDEAFNKLETTLGRQPTFDELKRETGLPNRMLQAFTSRTTMPLEEDTWAQYTDDMSFRVKEALAHIEAKYGKIYAKALEETEVGDKPLAQFCRENKLDYGQFYYKLQAARDEFKSMLF